MRKGSIASKWGVKPLTPCSTIKPNYVSPLGLLQRVLKTFAICFIYADRFIQNCVLYQQFGVG